MNIRRYSILFFTFFAVIELQAQSLRGLTENPAIKEYRFTHPAQLKSVSAIPLTLPFFEDFSLPAVVPDPDKWADENVFINTSFAIDPVSVGVATLDAIDANGDVYAMTTAPTVSDLLTTQPFNLSAYSSPDDTVRLSFFYQCGGKGEVPEIGDSLILEFYSPSDDTWEMAWFAVCDSVTDFTQVVLEIADTLYENGFRFRFKNITSISVNDVPGGNGALSNADCWNIDYIMMNTDPVSAHVSVNDITIMEPPRELMDHYESVPWSHLNYAQSITRNIMHYVIRNMHKSSTANVDRHYYVKYINAGFTDHYDNLNYDIPPDTIARFNDPFFAPFTKTDNSKEGYIEVGDYIGSITGQYLQNDTAKTLLEFKDYYAFDDGTPEYGFGIPGPATTGALLAMRFRVYATDTLRAVDMYFNKARNNYNEDFPFRLCVWDNDNGQPGNLIYFSDEVFTPGASTEMPEFVRYAIDPETDLIITDTVVYVGWQQESEEFINQGYDVNRNSLDKTFVNISGIWFNPNMGGTAGTIMMRAVFGGTDVITAEPDIPVSIADITLFPNPVSGILHIESPGTKITDIAVYDIFGRLIQQSDGQVQYIDMTGCAPGMYQVVMHTEDQKSIVRKIIVSQ